MIEKEDFETWLDSPITKDVFALFGQMGEHCKEMWMRMSWDNGKPDPLMLADLRGRYEAVEDMITITFDRYEGAKEIESNEPERDQSN